MCYVYIVQYIISNLYNLCMRINDHVLYLLNIYCIYVEYVLNLHYLFVCEN